MPSFRISLYTDLDGCFTKTCDQSFKIDPFSYINRLFELCSINSSRAIDATEFKEPVYVGEWVNFEALVTGLGKTSIKVSIKAYAEGRHDERRLACVSEFTMVAVKQNDDGSYSKCIHGQKLES